VAPKRGSNADPALKEQDLITSPFILLKAADHFAEPTTARNQLWPDFTYLHWLGRFYLLQATAGANSDHPGEQS
jgi:hypothetical protein